MTKYEKLVNIVANGFISDCIEDGFDTFADMVRCYQMDGTDIKGEVHYMVDRCDFAYMDFDSGDITIFDDSDSPYRYRQFIAAVRKVIKKMGF